jgi:hypothetical protein
MTEMNYMENFFLFRLKQNLVFFIDMGALLNHYSDEFIRIGFLFFRLDEFLKIEALFGKIFNDLVL